MPKFHTLPLVRQVMVLATLVSLLFIIILGSVVSWRMNKHAITQAENEVRNELNLIKGLLDLSYKNEQSRAQRQLELLENMYPGNTFSLTGQDVLTNGVALPQLQAGAVTVNNDVTIMREFTRLTGFKAALLVRKGNDLFHISTEITKPDGTSLVGLRTPLPPDSPMLQDILAGKRNYQVLLRDGKPNMIAYHPIKNTRGEVIAAVGMRIPLESSGLGELKKTIGQIKIGKTGYLYAFTPKAGEEMGIMMVHPTAEGKTINQLPDYVKTVIKQQIDHKNGTHIYEYPDPDSQSMHTKIMVHDYISSWNWHIAATVWQDEILEEANYLRNLIITLLSVAGVLMVLVLYYGLNSRLRPIDRLLTGLDAIGRGDLTTTLRVREKSRNELDLLAARINHMVLNIRHMITQVLESAQAVNRYAQDVQVASSQMQNSAHAQHNAAQDMARAIDQITEQINHIAENAHHANHIASTASQSSHSGRQVVQEAVQEMSKIASELHASADIVLSLGDKSSQISGIVDVIREIADQTNLLALNAAIEAARAGEQGRGFAVVADEVRKLAERTSQSTQEIAHVILSISQQTQQAATSMNSVRDGMQQGVELAKEAETALSAINQHTDQSTQIVRQIAQATQSQRESGTDISDKIQAISTMASQNAAASEHNRTTVQHLLELAHNLHQTMRQFRLH